MEFDAAGGDHLRQHDDSRHGGAFSAPVGAKKLLYLGSSCIYPRHATPPMKEEELLTGTLEPTNEAYAIAKIAGIKLCQSYRRQYGSDFMFGDADESFRAE